MKGDCEAGKWLFKALAAACVDGEVFSIIRARLAVVGEGLVPRFLIFWSFPSLVCARVSVEECFTRAVMPFAKNVQADLFRGARARFAVVLVNVMWGLENARTVGSSRSDDERGGRSNLVRTVLRMLPERVLVAPAVLVLLKFSACKCWGYWNQVPGM